MKRKTALLVLVAAVPLLVTSIARAGGSPGSGGNSSLPRPPATVKDPQIGYIFGLTFNAPTDTFQYTVTGAGRYFGVKTEDCCLEGDHWGVTIDSTDAGGTVGPVDTSVSGCGTGDISGYSGPAAASLSAGQTYVVIVSYCSGVDVFPAGMNVQFNSPNALTINPR
ncbi:MAG TPA: hypothetical protein VGA30_00365 [Actinomycetota bacterium]